LAIHVPPLATPQVVAADADDDHVIAAAIAATADVLDSGAAVLLSLRSYASQ
jgi:predicted nucleic acid-binding protein